MSLQFFAPAGIEPAGDKKERDDGEVDEISHGLVLICGPWERRRLVGILSSVAMQRAGETPAVPEIRFHGSNMTASDRAG
jgi:hypothetical protein